MKVGDNRMTAPKKPAQSRRRHKATTPEAAENQLISLSYDRAREKLEDGTASQQLITHFLKLGSSRDRLERQKLEAETKLVAAKVENLESQKRSEELYTRALEAMKRYSGNVNDDYE